MHLCQISVCDSRSFNIKSDDDKKRILEDLDRTYSVRVIRRHHDNFCEDRHVPIINRNPHLLSVRTNGNPYYLYLTRCDFVNQCVLIDKKVQQGYFLPRMILVRLAFDDHLFDNTLFEGEMVRDRYGGWVFLINDLLVYRDVPQMEVNLVRRISTVYRVLRESHVPDEFDVCALQVKRYFACSEMGSVLRDFVPRLPYTCRGLYFKPLFLKFRDILLNFDPSLIRKFVRVNYRGAGNFLLTTDAEKLTSQQQQQQQQSGSAPVLSCATAATAATEPVAQSKDDDERRRVLWVRHTNLPDVYELYENHADAGRGATTSVGGGGEIACVPSLSVSRYLRDVFQLLGVTDAVQMECVYVPKFGRWAPVRRRDPSVRPAAATDAPADR